MDELPLTQSFIQDDQKNEFLQNEFNYETCPHCQRTFFLGKLQYHLKLCKPSNPMIKSSLKINKKSRFSAALDKQKLFLPQRNQVVFSVNASPQMKYKKCSFCKATLPSSMIMRHQQKCTMKPTQKKNPQDSDQLEAKTKINFLHKSEHKDPYSALPRIRNSPKQVSQKQKTFESQDLKERKSSYTVKVREQLSCFKRALQVQQVQCHFCGRKFSKQASLRHIPICQKIKSHQITQIALKKHSKSQVYKLNTPVKRNLLSQSKMMTSASFKGAQQTEIRSARLNKKQKVDREKTNNTSFLKQPLNDKLKPSSDFQQLRLQQNQNVESCAKNRLEPITPKNLGITFNKESKNKRVNLQDFDLNPQSQQNLETHSKTPFFSQIHINQTNQSKSPGQEVGDQSMIQNQFLRVSEITSTFVNKMKIGSLEQNIEPKVSESPKLKQDSAPKLKLKIDLKDIES